MSPSTLSSSTLEAVVWQRQVFAAAIADAGFSLAASARLSGERTTRTLAPTDEETDGRADRRRYEVGQATGPGAAGSAAGGDGDADASVAAALPSPAAQVGSGAAVARWLARPLDRPLLALSLSRTLDAPGKRLQNRSGGKGLRLERVGREKPSFFRCCPHISKQKILNSVNIDSAVAAVASSGL